MSTAFKNAKQKQTQEKLRRLMNDHKHKQKSPQKIESPLAKYNDSGQLTCILCQSVVRSENVWTIHINSKQHREKVEHAKRLKERTNNFTTPLKRSLTPPLIESSSKKIKGILKNAPSKPEEMETEATEVTTNGIPDDFFDNSTSKRSNNTNRKDVKMDVDRIFEEPDPNATLPEGFFDDPKQDAKARNIEYKDPMEEEWEKFQKAIRDADNISAAIIAEDQEEATNERQIDEIDEQMKNWSRVLTLEQKKSKVIPILDKEISSRESERSESDAEENFDEFLDWRSKKSFRH